MLLKCFCSDVISHLILDIIAVFSYLSLFLPGASSPGDIDFILAK